MIPYDSTQWKFQHWFKCNGIHETKLENHFSTALAYLCLGKKHLIVPLSMKAVILIWGLSVHTSNTITARNSHWFLSHYIGCSINIPLPKKNPNQNNKPTHLIACSQSFTGFPLILYIPLYNVSSILLMLEIEGIYTYESSQPTTAYILFSFSISAGRKVYCDLNNESLQRKPEGKWI